MIFPKTGSCELCSRPLKGEELLCDNCKIGLVELRSCVVSQERFAILCDKETSFDAALSLFVYEQTAKEMVHALKYGGRTGLAFVCAMMMAKELEKYDQSFDFITFVPSSGRRVKKRGYNQAELLARQLSGIMGIPCISTVDKIKETPSQVSLDNLKRWKNLQEAFKFSSKKSIKGKKILLVDDVITTGTTCHLCSRQLRLGGACIIWVISIART